VIKYLLIPFILFFVGCFENSDETVSSEAKEIRQEIEESINEEFSEWIQNGRSNAEVIPSPKKVEVLSDSTARSIKQRGLFRATPTKFSLTDSNGDGDTTDSFITPVRDQGECGTCWVFAGIGALEGSYAKSSSVDFSEDQMKHKHGFDTDPSSGACSGGNMLMIMGYMSSFRGLINDDLDPYDDSKNSEYCSSCTSSKYVDNIIMVPTRRSSTDNDTIKDIVYNQKKPLYVSVQVGFGTSGESGASNFEVSTNSFLITTPGARANHAVVIVGWDDSYQAQGQVGAFIVKNSWGSGVGDAGYYYFPYADTTIGFGELAYVEDVEEDEFIFDRLYSHDEFGSIVSFTQSSGVELANVFTANRDEDLLGASYYIEDSGTDVTLQVHKVVSENPLVTEIIGETLTSETNKLRGFYTSKFAQPVKVKRNEKFAIVMRYSHASARVTLPVEAIANGFSSAAEASSGESFFTSNGSWRDLTTMRSDLNFPIKVMAIESVEEGDVSLHVSVSKTKVETNEQVSFSVTIEPSDSGISSVRWDFGDGNSSEQKSATHTYTSTGSYDVNAIVIDATGHQYTQKIEIRVVQEGLSTILDSSFTIFENAQEGDILGEIERNYSGEVEIQLSGIGYENFEVNSDAKVVIAKNAQLNFETTPFYNLQATPINGGGVDDAKDVNITIYNVDEHQPTLANLEASVTENSPVGTVVGSVVVVSSGDSTITSMALSGVGAADFNLSTSGLITVVSEDLDYETKSGYTLKANATNGSGVSSDVDVIIDLVNVPETLPVITAFSTTIGENTAPSTVIGTIVITSTGDTDISSIVLEGSGATDFSVDTQGAISVASGVSINFENQVEYNLSAVATNLKGPSDSVDVSISVTNSAEIKPVIGNFESIIFENTTTNLLIGRIPISENGDTPITSISLSGVGASDFSVSVDGNITIINSLDFSRQESYTLSGVASNAAGDSVASSVTITVKETTPLVTAKFKAEDAQLNDLFSSAVSVSGDMILVGAKDESSGGVAYLFELQSDQSYSQLLKITSADVGAGDTFGASVSMDDDIMLIGAPKDDDNGSDAGAIYLFKYFSSDNSALQLVKVKADTTQAGDLFGSSVEVNGDIILVGATEHNATGMTYLFKYSSADDSITQKTTFRPALITNGDGFGSDIAIDLPHIIVGTTLGEAGYLYRYDSSDDSVAQEYTFNSTSGVNAGDLFASKVSARNDSILFGSPGNDSAYLFKYENNTTTPLSKKITIAESGTGVKFGSDVAISDTNLVIGSENADSLYIYEYNEATFNINEPAIQFVVNAAGVGSGVGSVVELDDTTLAISAAKEDYIANDSGALFIANLDVDNRPFLVNYEPTIHVFENSITVFRSLFSSVNGDAMTFSIEGVDKDIFSIDSEGILTAQSLDFENPTDVGGNNIYSISLVLKDSAGMSISYDISIEVDDVTD